FTPELLRKDIDLGLALGREWDVPMPVTAATREVLQSHFGAATLKPKPEEYLQKDFAALMETMALAAGMKLESENKNVPTGLEPCSGAPDRSPALGGPSCRVVRGCDLLSQRPRAPRIAGAAELGSSRRASCYVQEAQMMSLRLLCGVVAVLLAGPLKAAAEDWPSRAIQGISPFTAGNANDIVARVVLDQVSKRLGQTFVIENRPGGGGTIGAAYVAKADPDGYTFLLHSSSLSSQVVLHRSLPYDSIRDFAAVVMFGIQPSVLVAAPSKGFKTVDDLVAAARA